MLIREITSRPPNQTNSGVAITTDTSGTTYHSRWSLEWWLVNPVVPQYLLLVWILSSKLLLSSKALSWSELNFKTNFNLDHLFKALLTLKFRVLNFREEIQTDLYSLHPKIMVILCIPALVPIQYSHAHPRSQAHASLPVHSNVDWRKGGCGLRHRSSLHHAPPGRHHSLSHCCPIPAGSSDSGFSPIHPIARSASLSSPPLPCAPSRS
jgi:hypothetical protein